MCFDEEKDGKLRGFVDYKAVSHIAKGNSRAILHTDEMFNCLGKATYFTKQHMKTCLYQIKIHPVAVE